MVLNGFLEDLLQRAGTTWHVDESSISFGEDGIFTDTVVEELGDMRVRSTMWGWKDSCNCFVDTC